MKPINFIYLVYLEDEEFNYTEYFIQNYKTNVTELLKNANFQNESSIFQNERALSETINH